MARRRGRQGARRQAHVHHVVDAGVHDDGLGREPARAPVYGLTCVFLYLVPAELASGWTGGVFRWVSEGLSPAWGLLAVWYQFAITIFYYPTL
jgi:hypothetical protein